MVFLQKRDSEMSIQSIAEKCFVTAIILMLAFSTFGKHSLLQAGESQQEDPATYTAVDVKVVVAL